MPAILAVGSLALSRPDVRKNISALLEGPLRGRYPRGVRPLRLLWRLPGPRPLGVRAVTERLLLCTDLDRTLLPNGAQPESPNARRVFARLVERPEVTLVYVSGRDRGLIEVAIRNYRLPLPSFAISDVGSTLYDLRDGDWQLWPRWHDHIAPDWAGHNRVQLAELLGNIDLLRPQEVAKQNTFKLSYYFPLHVDQQAIDELIEQRLRPHGIATNRIWSVDEAAGVGLLDIMPRSASKLHAVEFLQAELGVPSERILFAGDSGNDLQVLASAIPSVLVANAMSDVAQLAIEQAITAGNRTALYLALGGVLGMNGNYAAGILEGVAHFQPDLLPVLEEATPDPPVLQLPTE